MKKKIFLTILLVFVISASVTSAYAGSFLDDIINQGNKFGDNDLRNDPDEGLGKDVTYFIADNILPIVQVIGNLVFAAVTIILGVKYIWSGAEGRSEVLESLPAFVVSVIFFYLGVYVVDWLLYATYGIYEETDWDSIAKEIIGTINMVVRYAAFGGLLFMGLRYMFASAEGRSQIKTNMGGVALGIVFVFLASNVVDFIIDITGSLL